MDRVYLTKEGYEKIRSELERLQTKERPAVIKSISLAREFGDLSENAEYHAAKEKQLFIENKIASLQDKLVRSEIIDESQMPKDKAYLGATVTVKDEQTGKKISYMLVSTDEADFEENKISTQSPVGRALLGKGVGEKVEAKVPVGTLKYEIISIERK
ncbi:MAG: transcription elongation factor GreA [bacterium]|nr:transcription elongation factor GreA [bacterium]